jgi:hypothetical protein
MADIVGGGRETSATAGLETGATGSRPDAINASQNKDVCEIA